MILPKTFVSFIAALHSNSNKHRLFSFLAIGATHMIRHIIGVVIRVVGIAFARPRFFVLRVGIAFNQETFNCRDSASRPDNI